MVIAHTIRNRRYILKKYTEAIEWADTVEPIKQVNEIYSANRNFHELCLKCNDKTLIALWKALLKRKEEVSYEVVY